MRFIGSRGGSMHKLFIISCLLLLSATNPQYRETRAQWDRGWSSPYYYGYPAYYYTYPGSRYSPNYFYDGRNVYPTYQYNGLYFRVDQP